MYALGEGAFSCCGVNLAPLEAEEPDGEHCIKFERAEDEWYVTVNHPMTKDHFITFIAYVAPDGVTIKKLYPEQEAGVRFRIGMSGVIYACCNRHGLFRLPTPKRVSRAHHMRAIER